MTPLEVGRETILAYRRQVGGLEERTGPGPSVLRAAAWAGLQDSVPRAAILSLHARLAGVRPDVLDDPALAQVWGPRFSAYVVPAHDVAVFTLGRLPESGARRRFAQELAIRVRDFLAGRTMPYGAVGRGLGLDPNQLRYAALTGTLLIRWDGARQPTLSLLPPPSLTEEEARAELVRRFLHLAGPASPAAFSRWAGMRPAQVERTIERLAGMLVPVRTPTGEALVLAEDEEALRVAPTGVIEAVRLLPSGDLYTLCWDADRALLLPETANQQRLWTSRVWPGAVLVDGEVVGTWRRAGADLTVEPWRRLSSTQRRRIEDEAVALPLPGLEGPVHVRWS